jgi:hypothetical protein
MHIQCFIILTRKRYGLVSRLEEACLPVLVPVYNRVRLYRGCQAVLGTQQGVLSIRASAIRVTGNLLDLVI